MRKVGVMGDNMEMEVKTRGGRGRGGKGQQMLMCKLKFLEHCSFLGSRQGGLREL